MCSNSLLVCGSVNVNLYSEPKAVLRKKIKIACLSHSANSLILISLSCILLCSNTSINSPDCDKFVDVSIFSSAAVK